MPRPQLVHPELDNPPPGVPITEAAALLGLNRETLRQRIRRGLVAATKVDGQWYVQLTGCDTVNRPMHRTVEPDTTPGPSTDHAPDVAPDSELVSHLQAEVAFLRSEVLFLREELQRRDDLLAHKDELLATLMTRPAPPPDWTPAAPPVGPLTRKHRWWWGLVW